MRLLESVCAISEFPFAARPHQGISCTRGINRVAIPGTLILLHQVNDLQHRRHTTALEDQPDDFGIVRKWLRRLYRSTFRGGQVARLR
jgi:hypothetical protein